MEENKKTLIEYEEEISAAELREQKEHQKRRVRSFKRMLIVTFVAVCAIPIAMCTYLMIKMNRLDRRVETLVNRVEDGEFVVGETVDAENQPSGGHFDNGNLEKGTESDGVRVTLTDTKDGTDTSNSEETSQHEEQVADESFYNGKKVYLTFDDGPSTFTGELLDVLAEYNVKATFFVVYNDREDVQQYYNRIVNEGHSIGMHSYSHVYEQVYASEENFASDVESIHDFIYQKTGVDCRLYRFPGGSSNQVSKVDMQSLIAYLKEAGIVYYDWNSLSGDAVDSSLTPEQLNDNILGYVRANAGDSVVLMHDLQNNHATIEALPDLIRTLKEEGYEICPITSDTRPIQHVQYKDMTNSKMQAQ